MNNMLRSGVVLGLFLCFTGAILPSAWAQVNPTPSTTTPPPTDYEKGKTNMPTGSDFKVDSLRPNDAPSDERKMPTDPQGTRNDKLRTDDRKMPNDPQGTGNDKLRTDDRKMPNDPQGTGNDNLRTNDRNMQNDPQGTGNDNLRTNDKKMPQDPKMGTGNNNDNLRMNDQKMPRDTKMGTTRGDDMRMSAAEITQVIASWPSVSKMAAEATIQKYGQPTESTPSMLIWRDNGPWMKTVVSKEETQHDWPKAHKDCLQQTIRYDVPVKFYDDLARYDGSVSYERTRGTLSARCDREEFNFLALNLAYDIMTGKRTIEGARTFFAETVNKFTRGEKSTYTSALLFKAEKTSGDPDKASSMMNPTKGN